MTRQPSMANALAVAQPMPRLEPVTRATLPASLRSIASSSGASPRCAGVVFGNPGLHVVVIVGEIILGDVIGGGGPDAIMPEDVAQCLVEMLGRVRPADIVR